MRMLTSRDMSVLRRASEIAGRVASMRSRRANLLGVKAGLGHMRNVWHNAMLAHQAGQPWREVDYSALRGALRVENMESPSRIVDRLYSRMLAR